jgi:hypothetical protein
MYAVIFSLSPGFFGRAMDERYLIDLSLRNLLGLWVIGIEGCNILIDTNLFSGENKPGVK